MSRILVLSVIVASLSTVVGCGARAARATASPASVTTADTRDEECWTPPSEIAMSISEAKAPEGASATEGQEKMKGSYRPNRNDRPSAGAVHAATY